MVKEKNINRVEAGKKSACKNRWIKELKKTMKKEKVTYKQAMGLASQKKKQNIEIGSQKKRQTTENVTQPSSKKKIKENHDSQLSHK